MSQLGMAGIEYIDWWLLGHGGVALIEVSH